jgi:hypothetical protein
VSDLELESKILDETILDGIYELDQEYIDEQNGNIEIKSEIETSLKKEKKKSIKKRRNHKK